MCKFSIRTYLYRNKNRYIDHIHQINKISICTIQKLRYKYNLSILYLNSLYRNRIYVVYT